MEGMKTTLSPSPSDWREVRRFRAWELHLQGWTQKHIAAALGVTQGVISQWIQRALLGAVDALRTHKATGAPCRLTAQQRQELKDLLDQGAESFGFQGNVWTSARVATVIEHTWQVHYHQAHVNRILHQIGWTPQKPVVKATQRDEEAIATWQAERLPEIKKSRRRGLDADLL
jgi:transposase